MLTSIMNRRVAVRTNETALELAKDLTVDPEHATCAPPARGIRSPTDPLIIDGAMPEFDVSIAEHIIVRAAPATTFRAACDLDFLRVRTPLLVAAMWAREVPCRLAGRPQMAPPRLVLGAGDPLPGWLILGERAEREITFGAVGKFWQPDITWRDVEPGDFAAFAEPGWGKIAASFVVTPYSGHASLLTYECRTATTDSDSHRRFARYWWLIRPFVAHIFRATVRTIRDNAEAAGT